MSRHLNSYNKKISIAVLFGTPCLVLYHQLARYFDITKFATKRHYFTKLIIFLQPFNFKNSFKTGLKLAFETMLVDRPLMAERPWVQPALNNWEGGGLCHGYYLYQPRVSLLLCNSLQLYCPQSLNRNKLAPNVNEFSKLIF